MSEELSDNARERRRALTVAGTAAAVGAGALIAGGASSSQAQTPPPIPGFSEFEEFDVPLRGYKFNAGDVTAPYDLGNDVVNGDSAPDEHGDPIPRPAVSKVRLSRSGSVGVMHYRCLIGAALSPHQYETNLPKDPWQAFCIWSKDLPAEYRPASPPTDLDPFGESSFGGTAWISDPSKVTPYPGTPDPIEAHLVHLNCAWTHVPVATDEDFPVVAFFSTLSGNGAALETLVGRWFEHRDPSDPTLAQPALDGLAAQRKISSRLPFVRSDMRPGTKLVAQTIVYELATFDDGTSSTTTTTTAPATTTTTTEPS